MGLTTVGVIANDNERPALRFLTLTDVVVDIETVNTYKKIRNFFILKNTFGWDSLHELKL